ncbi:uncharacterized protein TNCV_2725891 [Trichonephila clavipes]|nr:uncharacterized protein TNCV_2725891 [Trichonephila clavipes]
MRFLPKSQCMEELKCIDLRQDPGTRWYEKNSEKDMTPFPIFDDIQSLQNNSIAHVSTFAFNNFFEVEEIDGKTCFKELEAKLLECLAEKLNFSFEIILSPRSGLANSNGTWDGVIGLVQSGEVDMGLGTLSISGERIKVVDFSVPYNILKQIFVVKEPGSMPKITVFTYPFTRKRLDLICFDDSHRNCSLSKNNVQKHHSLGEFSISVRQHCFARHGKCQRYTLEKTSVWFVDDHRCRHAFPV